MTAADVAKAVMEANSDSDIDTQSDDSDAMVSEDDDVASDDDISNDTNVIRQNTIVDPAGNSGDTNVISQGTIVDPVNQDRRRTTANKATTEPWTWTTTVKAPTTSFTGQSGFQNLPASLSPDSKMIDFFNLFLDNDFMQTMVDLTNLRASQTKSSKPGDYYAQRWSNVTVAEMRAFIGVRLSMEHLLIKPRYADYFATSRNLTVTPGYRSVFTRDRFLSIWKFWHIVDENDINLNKADKLYKVRMFIDHILNKFRLHYHPQQMLSIDELRIVRLSSSTVRINPLNGE